MTLFCKHQWQVIVDKYDKSPADRMRGQDIFAHINLMKGERSYLAELASDLL